MFWLEINHFIKRLSKGECQTSREKLPLGAILRVIGGKIRG